MTIDNKFLNFYILILLSIFPISILAGPAVSLSITLFLSLSFIFIFSRNNFQIISKNKTVLLLIVLYFYLILNSFISTNFDIGLKRNFGFIRYILIFIVINYFFFHSKSFEIIFKIWTMVFSLVFFDIFYEFFNGNNILGFVSENSKRIVSFFKDEQVVGAFLNGFIFILIGFLFNRFEKKTLIKKIFIFSFIIIAIVSMILTGERSNTIKFFLGLSIFFYFNDKINLKHKLSFIVLFVSLFFIFANYFFDINQKRNLIHRYYNDLVEKITHKEKRDNLIYFKLYNSGYEIFKKNPIFGVGNKNYRVESCQKTVENQVDYICSTHPHQIYFEFLSEHGLFGTLVLLLIIFYLIFKNYRRMILKKNLIQIGCFSYLLINFIPILPGGSFFADFNATFFWLNFSIYYAVNSDTNIFKKN